MLETIHQIVFYILAVVTSLFALACLLSSGDSDETFIGVVAGGVSALFWLEAAASPNLKPFTWLFNNLSIWFKPHFGSLMLGFLAYLGIVVLWGFLDWANVIRKVRKITINSRAEAAKEHELRTIYSAEQNLRQPGSSQGPKPINEFTFAYTRAAIEKYVGEILPSNSLVPQIEMVKQQIMWRAILWPLATILDILLATSRFIGYVFNHGFVDFLQRYADKQMNPLNDR